MKKIIIMILALLGVFQVEAASSTTLHYQVYFPQSMEWGMYQYKGQFSPINVHHATGSKQVINTVCMNNFETGQKTCYPDGTKSVTTNLCKADIPMKDVAIMSGNLSGAQDHFAVVPLTTDSVGVSFANVFFTGGKLSINRVGNIKDALGCLLNKDLSQNMCLAKKYKIYPKEESSLDSLFKNEVVMVFDTSDGKTRTFGHDYPTNFLYVQQKGFVVSETINNSTKLFSTELSVTQYMNVQFQLSLNFQQPKLENF